MSALAEVLPGVRRVEQIMGMPIVVDVRDDDVDKAALDHVFAWFRWVDAVFSTYKEDSEISRFARGELELADACGEVRYVLDRCEQLREETRGFFDVRAARPDAIAIVCTNMRGAPLAEELEAQHGIPVYDTVATTVWKSLKVAGVDTRRVKGWGRIFSV